MIMWWFAAVHCTLYLRHHSNLVSSEEAHESISGFSFKKGTVSPLAVPFSDCALYNEEKPFSSLLLFSSNSNRFPIDKYILQKETPEGMFSPALEFVVSEKFPDFPVAEYNDCRFHQICEDLEFVGCLQSQTSSSKSSFSTLVKINAKKNDKPAFRTLNQLAQSGNSRLFGLFVAKIGLELGLDFGYSLFVEENDLSFWLVSDYSKIDCEPEGYLKLLSASVYDSKNSFAQLIDQKTKFTSDLYFNLKDLSSLDALAFNDRVPRVKNHILVIPRKPYINFVEFIENGSHSEIEFAFREISRVARLHRLHETGFRIIANVCLEGSSIQSERKNNHAEQYVPHLHFHVAGGECLRPTLNGAHMNENSVDDFEFIHKFGSKVFIAKKIPHKFIVYRFFLLEDGKHVYDSAFHFAESASGVEIQAFGQFVSRVAFKVGILQTGFRVESNSGNDAWQQGTFSLFIIGGSKLPLTVLNAFGECYVDAKGHCPTKTNISEYLSGSGHDQQARMTKYFKEIFSTKYFMQNVNGLLGYNIKSDQREKAERVSGFEGLYDWFASPFIYISRKANVTNKSKNVIHPNDIASPQQRKEAVQEYISRKRRNHRLPKDASQNGHESSLGKAIQEFDVNIYNFEADKASEGNIDVFDFSMVAEQDRKLINIDDFDDDLLIANRKCILEWSVDLLNFEKFPLLLSEDSLSLFDDYENIQDIEKLSSVIEHVNSENFMRIPDSALNSCTLGTFQLIDPSIIKEFDERKLKLFERLLVHATIDQIPEMNSAYCDLVKKSKIPEKNRKAYREKCPASRRQLLWIIIIGLCILFIVLFLGIRLWKGATKGSVTR